MKVERSVERQGWNVPSGTFGTDAPQTRTSAGESLEREVERCRSSHLERSTPPFRVERWNGESETTGRWVLMLTHLHGDPLPPLPPIAGRLIKAPVPTDADPVAEAWDAEHPNKPTGGDQDD